MSPLQNPPLPAPPCTQPANPRPASLARPISQGLSGIKPVGDAGWMGTNFRRRRDTGPRAPSRADPGSEGLQPAGQVCHPGVSWKLAGSEDGEMEEGRGSQEAWQPFPSQVKRDKTGTAEGVGTQVGVWSFSAPSILDPPGKPVS